ncbi:alpha/beta-hydrolase, partial [Rhizodiscina lignyota]
MSNNGSEGDVVDAIQPYSMHVSARYLDLTKRKLQLTRLPREPSLPEHDHWRYGTPKTILEPLIDFWLEQYDWRTQEATLNNRLPQFRTTIALPNRNADEETTRSFRIHFVHKRCQNRNAIPLLFCHGWPGSFLEVCKIIDALTEPDFAALPPGARVPVGFHVVVPSIPGFGFSDASVDDGFGLEETAAVFDALMRQLGYDQYVAHGSECSCLAIHTISPNVPPPTLQTSFVAAVKYQIARLSSARLSRLSFGYTPSE